jgi:hypothetical protein
MWNCIWVIISPAKRLPVKAGIDHVREVVVVYPNMEVLGTLDCDDFAIKVTAVAVLGFTARPPEQVSVCVPTAMPAPPTMAWTSVGVMWLSAIS